MKPNPVLIKALRKVAHNLKYQESYGQVYNWSITEYCNCGLLVREILNIDSLTLSDIFNKELLTQYSNWSIAAENSYCKVTGIPLKDIFITLHQYGLDSPKDFSLIEFLGKEKNIRYYDPDAVSKFFYNLADDLEKQLLNRSVKDKITEAVPVKAID